MLEDHNKTWGNSDDLGGESPVPLCQDMYPLWPPATHSTHSQDVLACIHGQGALGKGPARTPRSKSTEIIIGMGPGVSKIDAFGGPEEVVNWGIFDP